VTVPPDARGERLDRYLATVSGLSRSRFDALKVHLDGKPAKAATRLKGGETLEWTVPPPVCAKPVAQDLPLEVLYQDRDLVAVNKAAGVVVHPGAGNREGTLVNALLHHVKDLGGVGGELRPGIVHRLDKDTTGVLVVAKNDRALERLQAQFSSREVTKTYLALVHGKPSDEGTFRTLYGRHPRNRLKFSAKLKRGKSAVTHWRVTRRLSGAARVEVTLETGRTHQIRVHFAEAGFPLLGDTLYGRKSSVIHRQALHAWRLEFEHPRTGKKISLEAPVPKDFIAAEEALARAKPA
jgi:23S rRNA pseudouridine1911/1915/1917 synthase